jgi:hypothetical protein
VSRLDARHATGATQALGGDERACCTVVLPISRSTDGAVKVSDASTTART